MGAMSLGSRPIGTRAVGGGAPGERSAHREQQRADVERFKLLIGQHGPFHWSMEIDGASEAVTRTADRTEELISGLAAAVRAGIDQVEDATRNPSLRVRLTVEGPAATDDFSGHASLMGPGVRLGFDDSSFFELEETYDGWLPEHESDEPRQQVDAGLAILEPITQREYGAVEAILAALWRAIDNDELTETQQHQIIAMAKLLEEQHRATEPGVTERWKILGVLRSVLDAATKDLPSRMVVLAAAHTIAQEHGWYDLAGELAEHL